METGGGGERLDSQNLRSFLRIKEEDHINHGGAAHSDDRGNVPGATLNSILADKRGPGEIMHTQSNRTLLDIIREESGNRDDKKSWRSFKNRLRLRRNGSGSSWTSSVPTPTSDIPIHSNRNPAMNRRPSAGFGDPGESIQFNSSTPAELHRDSSRTGERVSGRFEHTSSLAMRRLQRERNDNDDEEEQDDEEEEGRRSSDAEDEDEDEEGGGEGEGGEGQQEQQPVRMSLMSLLAETDRQMGLDGSAFMTEEDDEDDEEEDGGAAGGEYNTCCVCMVRHKGSAFIPCGHTFCRMCSRELWVQRGNCPLCNNYILEILDIF